MNAKLQHLTCVPNLSFILEMMIRKETPTIHTNVICEGSRVVTLKAAQVASAIATLDSDGVAAVDPLAFFLTPLHGQAIKPIDGPSLRIGKINGVCPWQTLVTLSVDIFVGTHLPMRFADTFGVLVFTRRNGVHDISSGLIARTSVLRLNALQKASDNLESNPFLVAI